MMGERKQVWWCRCTITMYVVTSWIPVLGLRIRFVTQAYSFQFERHAEILVHSVQLLVLSYTAPHLSGHVVHM